MIQVIVRYKDHNATIHFPCSENELLSALMEIHAADDNPAELFILDVEYPKELDILKNRFVNLDELNFLAKRMESFWGLDEVQFFEARKQEGFTELKDLINLTLNLNRYTLIQNVGNMAEIGREYKLNTEGSIPASDEDNSEYAELGRKLVSSGKGIFTENGLLFINKDLPFEEPYDGQVFPPYLYDSSLILTGTMEYKGKTEYVYLPCEELAIDKSVKRLGAEFVEDTKVTLEDFNVDNPEWFNRMKDLCAEEGIHAVNRLSHAIRYADMDLQKLSALVRYADVDSTEDIIKLAENMELFVYVPNTSDYENIGRHFVSMNPEYQIHSDVAGYFDFDKFGKAMAESHEGDFLEGGGYVCIQDGQSLEEILDIDESMKMGGM